MTKTIDVKVLGRSFRFDIPKDIDPDTFMEIIVYVEDKIRSVRGQSIDLDSFRLGLLTSINIAADLFAMRRENEDLRVVMRRIDDVISSLDQPKPGSRKAGRGAKPLHNTAAE